MSSSWELANYVSTYAAKGWKVFPVTPGQKTPALTGWQNFNASDPDNIDAWWGQEFYNVGIQTGRASGILVLDVDPRHDGDESLLELERRFGPLPDTVRVLTANAGVHYYFDNPTGESRNGTKIFGLSGLDVRGDGGYVVAPPSALDTGGKYEWDLGAPRQMAHVPKWLVERENERAAPIGQSESFPEGTRNEALTRIAGSLRYYGISEATILSTLLDVNDEKCSPPLAADEVELIARSSRRWKPTYSPGRGESRDSRSAGNERGRADGFGLPKDRALHGKEPQRHIRSGAWYLDRGR